MHNSYTFHIMFPDLHEAPKTKIKQAYIVDKSNSNIWSVLPIYIRETEVGIVFAKDKEMQKKIAEPLFFSESRTEACAYANYLMLRDFFASRNR